jgi:hypothetical protein
MMTSTNDPGSLEVSQNKKRILGLFYAPRQSRKHLLLQHDICWIQGPNHQSVKDKCKLDTENPYDENQIRAVFVLLGHKLAEYAI